MKYLKLTIAVMFLALFSGCTTQRFVENLPAQSVEVASASEMKKALITAATVKGWRIVEDDALKQELVLELSLREHYLKVSVIYDDQQYQVSYLESRNLNYNKRRSTIHTSYERWLRNLDQAVQSSAISLSLLDKS